MAEKKQALLIFTKPPLPGVVKTRMTNEYGGFFTMEQAAQFYKCCFYDVCEMSVQALMELQAMNDELVAADPTADKITYDFFCSTTPEKSLPKVQEVFDAIGPWPMDIHFIVDSGTTFDEHFNDAFEQIFAMGYESIVSIGGDVPTMPKSHLIQAFQWLDYFQSLGTPGFVYAPCQECGTSLVGFSHNTVMDHTGVYYNMDGRPALDGYLEKLQEANERAIFLSIRIISTTLSFFRAVLIMGRSPHFMSGRASWRRVRAYSSPFCLAMKASTLSITWGTRSMMRSTVVLAGGVMLIMRTVPSLMTKKPMGSIFTPVALPPP